MIRAKISNIRLLNNLALLSVPFHCHEWACTYRLCTVSQWRRTGDHQQPSFTPLERALRQKFLEIDDRACTIDAMARIPFSMPCDPSSDRQGLADNVDAILIVHLEPPTPPPTVNSEV
jgi:hypothetical protein